MSAVEQPALDALSAIRAAVCSIVHGKEDVVERAIIAVLAGGHLLLEDVPGVGKTTLAHALAASLGGSFSRVQFTSDLLPGDITGVTVLEAGTFSFREGPLFANVVLADEINRASPKTQSALFEAMEERQVTVDGETRQLPQPFMVVATQNPFDQAGTFTLPDSQLDRFLMRLSLGYPDRDAERQILRQGGLSRVLPDAVVDSGQVADLIAAAQSTRVPEEVEEYLLDLVRRTRHDPGLVRGVSTRGGQALFRAVRARAAVRGRSFAIPEDVRELAVPVLAHRVLVRGGTGRAEAGIAAISALLEQLPSPL